LVSLLDFCNKIDLPFFLQLQKSMAIKPFKNEFICIEGQYNFTASIEKYGVIKDSFNIRILLSNKFPKEIPEVYEIGNRIPRNPDYHIYKNGLFCLGSPFRLLLILSDVHKINEFAERCINPYLYSISYKLSNGGKFVIGELDHGIYGEISDYIEIFGLKNARQVLSTIKCLGMKKRRANKLPCPCGCNKRLGKCRFNFIIRKFRKIANRSYYRTLLENIKKSNIPREN